MVKETIREIQLKDKNQWEKLYKGYADFYKVEMNDKILQEEADLWLRLIVIIISIIIFIISKKNLVYPTVLSAILLTLLNNYL